MKVILLRFLVTFLFAAIFSFDSAMAHEHAGHGNGFSSGFQHPLLGLDHLIAMVAVGLWGAQLGNPAIWILPVTFPVVMAFGAAAGVMGLPLPLVELGIAGSAIALGVMVAVAGRPPLWIAALLVGAFAIFHGYAHGAELPQAVNPLAYGSGFVLATGLLHLTGILIGLMIKWPVGAGVVRFCGGLIAVSGAYFFALHSGLTG